MLPGPLNQFAQIRIHMSLAANDALEHYILGLSKERCIGILSASFTFSTALQIFQIQQYLSNMLRISSSFFQLFISKIFLLCTKVEPACATFLHCHSIYDLKHFM